MLVYLLRHGQTAYNAERRYQGVLDIPLSEEGLTQLHRADIDPEVVYVSSLRRTVQTAQVLFPRARLVPVPNLREMNFGVFQGHTATEMANNAAYQEWLEGGCVARCPQGESRAEFSNRVCTAFAQLVDQAVEAGDDKLVIVAHGGTQMAALERFAQPARPYSAWCAGNASGYLLDAACWRDAGVLEVVGELCYAAQGVSKGRALSFWAELAGSPEAGGTVG